MFSNHFAPAAARRRPFWATRRPRTAIPVIAAGATFAAVVIAMAEEPRVRAGTMLSVPYSADYGFYRKSKSTRFPGAMSTAEIPH
jgi:hypothetical protein